MRGEGWSGTGGAARGAVLDHLLGLVAGSPRADHLVLRGSMTMPAWVGEAARAPADLDFLLLPELAVPVDPLDPHPYVDRLAEVQHWPEAADGAARYEIWRDGWEEYEVRGLRAVPPPEGTHWEVEPDPDDLGELLPALTDLIRRFPEAAPGLGLDPNGIRTDAGWTYDYSGGGYRFDTTAGEGGLRVLVPWQADGGGPEGVAQLDFAYGERLSVPPVWTLVPRGDGGPPALLRTASAEQSLAWKLRWLRADAADGRSRAKDLYDAVLLSERPGARLPGPAVGTAGGTGAGRAEVRVEEEDWRAFRSENPQVRGSAADWLRRLETALARTAAEVAAEG
ncbi:nucleotidyl transferase AbiEii/AbiGii toxin family protein [Kitasatospora camelliae]|uniref:Nucleotidyl transferase AbiEii/AbiGii toxin family protein n=1 Tax=Kitasatospora camelliae TaxID=3156397 RepID=A0AAU8K4Q4_9ACTN